MKVRVFISFSSLVLFAWLTATFVRAVPMETYDAPLAAPKAREGDVSAVLMVARAEDRVGRAHEAALVRIQ